MNKFKSIFRKTRRTRLRYVFNVIVICFTFWVIFRYPYLLTTLSPENLGKYFASLVDIHRVSEKAPQVKEKEKSDLKPPEIAKCLLLKIIDSYVIQGWFNTALQVSANAYTPVESSESTCASYANTNLLELMEKKRKYQIDKVVVSSSLKEEHIKLFKNKDEHQTNSLDKTVCMFYFCFQHIK